MNSLRDRLIRLPEVRTRHLSLLMAPAVMERELPTAQRYLEEAALTLLGHVFRDAGPIREQLLYAQGRFQTVVQLIHRLPNRQGGG